MLSKKSMDEKWFNIFAYSIAGTFALLCVIPFWIILVGSFSSEGRIIREGYGLWIKSFSLESYKVIFNYPQKIINAYMVSIFVSSSASMLSLLIISMTSYVLYRQDFKYRNKFAFLFYFTTLFNGGMVPAYILMVRYLHLKNSLLALILPGIFDVFFLIVMRNFMTGMIPYSLVESAKIDGAGDFHIYRSIVLPLITPALATIGLFEILKHWNNWHHAMLYISKENMYPLQYLLYRMLQASKQVANEMTAGGVPQQRIPGETLKLAMTVVAIGPIVFVYPFVQRYFVSGMTVGAIKG